RDANGRLVQEVLDQLGNRVRRRMRRVGGRWVEEQDVRINLRTGVLGVAIDQDAWFVDAFVTALAHDIAVDLGDTTPGALKGALVNDDVAPDFGQEDPAYGTAPWDAGEASGTGYTAGGADLTVTGWGQLSDVTKVGWSFDPVLWADSTISASGLLVYAPGLS